MKAFITAFLLILFSSQIIYSTGEQRLLSEPDPDIYKDKIVFTYENDLWLVSSNGGTATQINKFSRQRILCKIFS